MNTNYNGIISDYITKLLSIGSNTLIATQQMGLDVGISIPLDAGFVLNIQSGVEMLNWCNGIEQRKSTEILLDTGVVIVIGIQYLEVAKLEIMLYANRYGRIVAFQTGRCPIIDMSMISKNNIMSAVFKGLEAMDIYTFDAVEWFVNQNYYCGRLTH